MSSSISAYTTALGQYLIGKEKDDRENTKLKNAVISDSVEEYKNIISQGYNPYRVDKNGKMSFEYAECQEKFKALAVEWIHQLAFEINPDISDSVDEDRLKTFTEVSEYIKNADGHQLAMLREHMSSMSNSEDSDSDSDELDNCTVLNLID